MLLSGRSATPKPASTNRFCAERLSITITSASASPIRPSRLRRMLPNDSGWRRISGKPIQRCRPSSSGRCALSRDDVRWPDTTTRIFSCPMVWDVRVLLESEK